MRVTLDSNAWEQIYEPMDSSWLPVREAFTSGKIRGFICDIGFRIEAIPKRDRLAYFSQPAMEVVFPFDTVMRDGKRLVRIMSMGPG